MNQKFKRYLIDMLDACADQLERMNQIYPQLVVLQHDNYGSSVPVVFRSKAQCADNGRSLVKHCNVAAEHHRDALWVSLSTPTDCVAPFDKGIAIICKTRLAVNVDKLTGYAIIMLKDH